MKRFFSRLFGSKSRSVRPRCGAVTRPARPRLGVELLEDRRLMAAGWLDPSFGGYGQTTVMFDLAGARRGFAEDVAIQADGKIVVVGFAAYGASGDRDFAIARLNPDGSLDTTFGSNGKTTVPFDLGGNWDDRATAVAIDANGNIVVTGDVARGNGNYDIGTARLTPDGWLDWTFGIYGKSVAAFDIGGSLDDRVTDLVIDSQGRIVLVGSAQYNASGDNDFAVVRLQENGYYDPSFAWGSGKRTVAFDLGGTLWDGAGAVALDALDRIVVAGSAARTNDSLDFAITRLLDDGSLDESFGWGGKQNVTFDQFYYGYATSDIASDLAIDSQGRIVVAGSSRSFAYDHGRDSVYSVTRLLDDGSFDTSFGWGGMQIVNFNLTGYGDHDGARAVAIDSQGRIVLAGTSSVSTGYYDSSMARLLDDGSLDESFGRGGWQWFDLSRAGREDQIFAMVLDDLDRPVVVGYVGLASPWPTHTFEYDFLVARVES